MKRISLVIAVTMLAGYVAFPVKSSTQELKPVVLLKPRTDAGGPLMQVLMRRRSVREFSKKKLPLQVLSDMLWAAFGVNRPESGKRTAPSARNRQEIDIYVAAEEGLFLYDAAENILKPVLAEDVRAATGKQPFVKDAPVNLIYVADYSRMGNGSEETKAFYSAADAGFISQNVYLFCASEGLCTVVRGLVEKGKLATVMKLRDDQKVVLAQTVGYPKE